MGLFDDAGRALRRLREEKGLLQKEVSERSGVTKGMLSRIENDKADTTLGTLGRILEGMGAEVDDFSRVLKTVQRGKDSTPEEASPLESAGLASASGSAELARPKVYVMVEMPARTQAESDEAARRERADVLGEIERAIETFYPAPRVEETPPAVETPPPPIENRADDNREGER
jgi:transcriptional regulator with XRE-family HTH domain